MAGITSLMNGVGAAWTSFRNAWDSPENVTGGKDFNRAPGFRLLWAMYDNSIFEDRGIWGFYRSQHRLYRNTRALYNPMRRLADFYAGQVYPGVLSEDGKLLPDGVPLAIPLAEDTPPALKQAIGQLWQWSNWQSGKSLYVRYGAIAGSVLVEIVDEVDRGKVTLNIVWPSLVEFIDLDRSGNVQSYALRYLATDDRGMRYQYRKVVDRDTIATFRDNQPYDYTGDGAVIANPYGFVAAVWAKHKDVGGDYGVSCISGSIGKINEINSVASHTHDQIHKVIGAPVVLWSEGAAGALSNLFGGAKRAATDELANPDADRESVLMIKGPQGGRVDTLAGNLPLADAALYLDKLLGEVEQDHPELTLYRELRAMSQVTGPGAARLMGDAAAPIAEASANYDTQLIKIHQMAVAIAGWRLSMGAWGPPNRQQVKFAPFDLASYQRGDLDHAIMPRPLVPITESERLTIDRQRLGLQIDTQAGADVATVAKALAGRADKTLAAGSGA